MPPALLILLPRCNPLGIAVIHGQLLGSSPYNPSAFGFNTLHTSCIWIILIIILYTFVPTQSMYAINTCVYDSMLHIHT